jgi:soluble lytic murein transglycosylase
VRGERSCGRWQAAGATLLFAMSLILAEPARAATAIGQERVDQILQAADDGDWSWAQHLAAGLGVPQLRAYVRWRELLESTDHPPFAAYQEFLARGSDWPSLGTLQTRAEDALDDSVSVEQRLAFFADRAPRTRQGRILYAEALLASDRRGEAAALVRQSWVEDDFGKDEERAFLDRFAGLLQTQDHTARLDRLLWDGRTDQARRMIARVGGSDRAVGTARLKLQLGDPGVEAALSAVPAGGRRDPGLLYDRLRWRRERGNEAGAREILSNPPDELARPEKWWNEQQDAIREAIGDGAFDLAYRMASRSRQKAGGGLAEAEWLAGWLALRHLGQPQIARRHFERLWPAVTTPISRARAGYWAGRAAAAMGDRKGAADWYRRAAAHPNAFYGQLAAEEVGWTLADRVPPVTKASPAAREALRRRTPAALAAIFCGLDRPEPAQPFFRHLGYEAAADPEELRAVVDLARDCDRPDLILTVTRAAASNGTHLVQDAFPLPRTPAFRQNWDGGPEPSLVLAVARQESLFDPAARSPAGALGLMQLMPGTAQSAARELGIPFSKSRLISDPDYNVRLGALYLRGQLDRFDDEPVLALAAYNAGPARVSRWLEVNGDPRGADRYRLIDWIELIPFGETRNYVQRVLEGRGMYRAILAGSGSAPARTAAEASPAVPRTKPAS